MNEFIEQFLIESRELVQQATDDLLALEKSPHDQARFDGAFRAFHTLKGGAGIVEFAAMEKAVHAAENVLAAARSGVQPLSARSIGDCLACLDQVVKWLDEMQGTGDVPKDAGAATAAVVARFAQSSLVASQPAATVADAVNEDWLAALLRAHSDAKARARTAIRYRPDTESFFRDHDPAALVAALPGLLAVEVELGPGTPRLEDLDPFSCNLVFAVLLEASRSDVEAALGDEREHCDVVAVGTGSPSAAGPLSKQAHAVLEAQVALLSEVGGRHEAGRIGSAGLVAANVLRYLGKTAEAARIVEATAACVAKVDPAPLRQAIAAALPQDRVAAPAEPTRAGAHDGRAQTLRVDAARIDALVRVTGELTVAKNAIGHAVKLAQDEGAAVAETLKSRHAALDRLVGELQRSVLGMRVLPLRVAFQRFPRLIREMSAELRKPATLVVEGEDTEADKAIVEILVEPLLHVVRNALDHGVESAAVRSAAGKPAVATIRLRASRQGEHVLLEVSDDGGGVDVARVREVAKQRNVVSAEILAAMSDAEMIDLIFAPGFSTATTVTDLSGRGVGMDAVRTAVKRLGGQVEVASVAGKGTTVRFTLPFSVMMTQVMTVEAGGQMFGIPLDAIVETLRVPRERIFAVGAARAIVLRERTVPLVQLARVLAAGAHDADDDTAPIVVTMVDGNLGALQVDKVGERMEIMLKPLDGLLSGTPGIAGSTLLGDGSVLLVLDLAGLIQ